MKSRAFNPTELDVAAFAKQAAELQGQWPLAELDRLGSSVLQDAGAPSIVTWHAAGEHRKMKGAEPQSWLHVAAQGEVRVECQRCLKPVAIPLSVERSFLFVHGETTAAELDVAGEEDVLALTCALDLRLLIEDELLLALPLVPRHEECPQPLAYAQHELPEDETSHPFAALASFKRGGLSD